MRQRFEQQTTLGIKPISEVEMPLRSRDELPPVLMALKHIFVTPELNEKIFCLLEEKICERKKKTGRKGMDLWHILVLAIVRHTLDTNWDRLEYHANYDSLIRKILGIHVDIFGEKGIEFSYQSIIDNVSLIDEELIYKINEIVVMHGQQLLKKKGSEDLRLKTDSFVLETNIHFPTDLNLLWDSLRKCLDTVKKIKASSSLTGWRKVSSIKSNIKGLFRSTSQQVFRGKDEGQKKKKVTQYIQAGRELCKRFTEILINPPDKANDPIQLILQLKELDKYLTYANTFINQVERRLIKDEKIDPSEKIYSIFEPHTEWISKGKTNKAVELGHLLLITTDQNHLIMDYKIMEREKDPSQIEPLTKRLQVLFGNRKIYSHSFDKGFYSKDNYEILNQAGIENIILPKKGKLNRTEKERESTKEFKTLRKAHSAVESNINMLEHHGLNRCPDKGINGFKEYVGLSVLAYNLHIIGNHLKAEEEKKEKILRKQRERYRLAA